jgi:galactokinase
LNATPGIAAHPRDDDLVRVSSLNVEGQVEFSLDNIKYDEDVAWSNYVRGVAHVLRFEGYSLTGFDGLVHSTIPFGSGLSSSAALEVSTAILFQVLGNLEISKLEIAKYCQRAENEFTGMDCGILDQYSSIMGQRDCVLLLDCRTITSEVMPIAPGLMVMICDTKAKRALTGSEYSERRAACEKGTAILKQAYSEIKTLRNVSFDQFEAQRVNLPEVVAQRCQFVIEENQRVINLAAALETGDRQAIGDLALASFSGARDLYEISCSEMDAMIEAMLGAPGVIGARQAGAGFGGCMLAIIEEHMIDPFTLHVIQKYRETTGITAEVYQARASRGAGVLDL